VGIASARRWPCVGDPKSWEPAGSWFTCGAEGVISVLALVPAGTFAEPAPGVSETDPVLVHLTVCKAHTRPVRHLLALKSPEPTWSLSTEILLAEWNQIVEPVQVPVWTPVALSA